MHSPVNSACKIHTVAVHTLHRPQYIVTDPLAAHLLVLFSLLRKDKYKRIFYMQYCELSEATHLYVVNYDEEASIAKKEIK